MKYNSEEGKTIVKRALKNEKGNNHRYTVAITLYIQEENGKTD